MNAAVKEEVPLLNGALMERGEAIVGHGWLSVDTLSKLKVGPYQREVILSKGGRSKLIKALEAGASFPDVMLGTRGQNYRTHGSTMYLEDQTYIVDGLQRIYAMLKFSQENPEKAANLKIGAEVRFGTTQETETDLFHKLNADRAAMSPNVLLRNMRAKNNAILTVYGLSTNEPKFALNQRVQWNQTMKRSELISAVTVCRTMDMLFRHDGVTMGGRADAIVTGLGKRAEAVGLRVFRQATIDMFDLVDECWGVRSIEYRDRASQLRGNFLITLARIMADHTNFWDGRKLSISSQMKASLSRFPIHDPEISRLCAAGNSVMPLLYNFMLDHLNKGKTKNRLIPRQMPASKDLNLVPPRNRGAR